MTVFPNLTHLVCHTPADEALFGNEASGQNSCILRGSTPRDQRIPASPSAFIRFPLSLALHFLFQTAEGRPRIYILLWINLGLALRR